MSYPDENLPAISVPHYAGERYEADVPDTLDLAEKAELSIHAITQMLDPDRDYQMATTAEFDRRPPAIGFASRAPVCEAKHLESLPLLRIMSGSAFNLESDKHFMESLLRLTAEDGAVYTPPYVTDKPEDRSPGRPPFEEPYGLVEAEGRLILTLCMWYQRDRNPLWRTLVEKKISRLTELGVAEEDFVYFTIREPLDTDLDVRMWFTARDTAETLRDPAGGRGWFTDLIRAHEINFQCSRSLCIYYRLTGYEPALELAGKIIRGVLKITRGFEEDGRWLLSHFHTATASLLAMFEYATLTDDTELLAFVVRCYEYGKAVGDSLVGFFAEHARGSVPYREGWGGYWPGEDLAEHGYKSLDVRDNTCELCEVADMVGLALKLTLAGAGNYWEDADRWLRNQYVEGQMSHSQLRVFLDNLYERELFQERPVEPWESDEIERAIGGFSISSLPNDWGLKMGHACCTGNASRTYFWIWDSILTKQGDLTKVNLLLNRASPWLDVDSYLPYEGKVVLKIKETAAIATRIPSWTERGKVSCKVNGSRRDFAWSEDYVEVSGLTAGDVVTVEFPMREETLFSVIGDKPFRLTLRGNTVVDIDPQGELCPLYQRDHFKHDKAPIKKVSRFVSKEAILW